MRDVEFGRWSYSSSFQFKPTVGTLISGPTAHDSEDTSGAGTPSAEVLREATGEALYVNDFGDLAKVVLWTRLEHRFPTQTQPEKTTCTFTAIAQVS
jgi:hypothetical protein